MRIAVTGMGGELGTRVALLLEARDDVSAIMGLDLEPPRRHLRRAEYHRVDPRDRERMISTIAGFAPTVLVHLGVYEPHARSGPTSATTRTAVGTIAALDACLDAGTLEAVVVRSGIEVYGRGPGTPVRPDESVAPDPTSPFGESLLHAERVAVDGGAKAGVPVSLLRCAPVVGPALPEPARPGAAAAGGAGAVVRLGPVLRAAPGGRRRRHRGGRDPAPRRPGQRRRQRCGVGHRGRAPRWRGAHADVGPGLAGGRRGHRDRRRAAAPTT